MQTLCFRYFGRVGQFMRAEMNASALSYPVPPRTALLGVIAAMIGLPKDALAEELQDAMVGLRINQRSPVRHYHKANIRKRNGIINPVSVKLKPAKTGATLPDESGRGVASQVTQEWLIKPDFLVYVASSQQSDWFADLSQRVNSDHIRNHYSPCMGQAWMTAQIEQIAIQESQKLETAEYHIATVTQTQHCEAPQLKRLVESAVAVQEVRLPRSVTTDRIFSHENYYLEMNGLSVPLTSSEAWQFGDDVITFL